MDDVIMLKNDKEISSLDVAFNRDKLCFDMAVSELTIETLEVENKQIENLKYYVNTWGLSSNNYFAEGILPKLKKLEYLDFSNTLKK